jgi:hypothetical protein
MTVIIIRQGPRVIRQKVAGGARLNYLVLCTRFFESPAALISHIFQYNTASYDNLKHFVFPRPLATNGTSGEAVEEEGG